jgi:uncharacterized protein YggE
MRFLATFVLLAVSCGYAQINSYSNTISITGDAAINVAPDRVRLNFGVQTRNKALHGAVSSNDAIVRRVIAAARGLQVEEGDIQTENIHVSLAYDSHDNTLIDYYEVTKGVQVFLRDVSKFEPLMMAVLRAGANQIYDVEFSTSELRKYRDQARALAVKAATEKANDLAAAAGFKASAKPVGLGAYSAGGGSWYGFCCGSRGYGSQWIQNVVQNVGGGGGVGPEGTVALGKMSVTASVTMTFGIQ